MTDEKLDELLKEALTVKNDDSELIINRKARVNMTKRKITVVGSVAACAAIAIVSFAWGASYGKPASSVAVAPKVEEKSSEVVNDTIKDVKNNFNLTPYMGEIDEHSTGIGLYDIGIGDGSYSGLYFKIEGDKIAKVDISITKGELYTSVEGTMTKDEFTDSFEEALANGEDPYTHGNPNQYCVYSVLSDSDSVTYYDCKRQNKEINMNYDPNTMYGFYIPDDAWDDSITDLRENYWAAIDTFDEDELQVKVTFKDGEVIEKTYALETGKITDENDIVHYGIIATEVVE